MPTSAIIPAAGRSRASPCRCSPGRSSTELIGDDPAAADRRAHQLQSATQAAGTAYARFVALVAPRPMPGREAEVCRRWWRDRGCGIGCRRGHGRWRHAGSSFSSRRWRDGIAPGCPASTPRTYRGNTGALSVTLSVAFSPFYGPPASGRSPVPDGRATEPRGFRSSAQSSGSIGVMARTSMASSLPLKGNRSPGSAPINARARGAL